MKTKIVGFFLCMLLIATALPAVGTLNNKIIQEPIKQVPDLDCSGSLIWVDVPPGSVVTGTITVLNIGDAGSLLDWEIESCPSWGVWTFVPSSGTGLTPEMGPIIITVEIVVPDIPCTTFNGDVIIININDPSDFCTIPVSLNTMGSVVIDIPSSVYSGTNFDVELLNNCNIVLNGINWRIDWNTICSFPPGYPAGFNNGIASIPAFPGSVFVHSGSLPPAGSGLINFALLRIDVKADCAADENTIALLLHLFGSDAIIVFP